MSMHHNIVYLYRLLHRYNPFRETVELIAIGAPTQDSPVFVSGNYSCTVDELKAVLQTFDCWLLICDSAGINVWCAAGVGDFNENKITDAIIATKLEEHVRHRRLIFPPLAAVGINRTRLQHDTGFSISWGPVHLKDLPEFIRNGFKRTDAMKLADFPLKDRLEQAIGIMGVFSFPAFLAIWWPRQTLWFMFSLTHAIFGSMLGYFRLFPKYSANKTVLLGAIQAGFLTIWHLVKGDPEKRYWNRLFLGFFAHFLIAIDMIGSTPFFKSTIIHWLATGDNESLFQPNLTDRCTSCGYCQEVCPKGLFSRNEQKKIQVDLSRVCCECLACVKQCPHLAIENAGSGFKDDIKGLDEEQMKLLRKFGGNTL